MPKNLSADDIDDINNLRGCCVPDAKIASHYGIAVDELLQAIGLPAKTTPAADVAADTDLDLWRADGLQGVL